MGVHVGVATSSNASLPGTVKASSVCTTSGVEYRDGNELCTVPDRGGCDFRAGGAVCHRSSSISSQKRVLLGGKTISNLCPIATTIPLPLSSFTALMTPSTSGATVSILTLTSPSSAPRAYQFSLLARFSAP